MHNPLICAIDTPDLEAAVALAARLKPVIGMVKLGLEFFTAHGKKGVERIAEQAMPIFLDLKFHDIPNTVRGAVRALADLPIACLTVHASGGKAMLEAASEAAATLPANPRILAVTVLTSLDEAALHQVGVPGSVPAQVERLALLAMQAGVGGIVCSPQELRLLRPLLPADRWLVTPGIRPASATKDDQARTLTPQEALASGATYLVVGRPITGSADPVQAARELLG
jgi:orotidine-5'-phosphate decarboxylase